MAGCDSVRQIKMARSALGPAVRRASTEKRLKTSIILRSWQQKGDAFRNTVVWRADRGVRTAHLRHGCAENDREERTGDSFPS